MHESVKPDDTLARTFANWREHYSASSEERKLFDQVAAALARSPQDAKPVAWRYRYRSKSLPEWSEWILMSFDPSEALDGATYEVEIEPLYPISSATPPLAIEALREALIDAAMNSGTVELPDDDLPVIRTNVFWDGVAAGRRAARDAIDAALKSLGGDNGAT